MKANEIVFLASLITGASSAVGFIEFKDGDVPTSPARVTVGALDYNFKVNPSDEGDFSGSDPTEIAASLTAAVNGETHPANTQSGQAQLLKGFLAVQRGKRVYFISSKTGAAGNSLTLSQTGFPNASIRAFEGGSDPAQAGEEMVPFQLSVSTENIANGPTRVFGIDIAAGSEPVVTTIRSGDNVRAVRACPANDSRQFEFLRPLDLASLSVDIEGDADVAIWTDGRNQP